MNGIFKLDHVARLPSPHISFLLAGVMIDFLRSRNAPRFHRSAHGWAKPTLLFLAALLIGGIASVVWLARHPPQVGALASDEPAAVGPPRRALPAPATGGWRIDLPAPAVQAPDAPHVVPNAPPSPDASEAAPSTVPGDGAETVQDQAQTPADATLSTDHDHGPKPSVQTPVHYPAQALRERAEGTVRLLVSVDAQGNVVDVRVVHGSGSSVLDRAAQDGVRGWHYRPAMHAGQPVPSTLEVPVDFKLDGQ